MTPTAARKIAASLDFAKAHRRFLENKDTQNVLMILKTVLCRPVHLPLNEVTAERSIYANAFAAGATAVFDVMEDVGSLREVQTPETESFQKEE